MSASNWVNSLNLPGSGFSFLQTCPNWNLLKGYDSKKNWLLAGGLKASNIIEALKI